MGMRRNIATVSTGLLGLAAVSALAVSLTFNQEASAVVPGVNQLVSQSTGGSIANNGASITNHAVSADGRFVVFSSSATNLTPEAVAGVFIRDTISNTTSLVSLSDTGSPVAGNKAKISYDGKYVIFESNVANVVSGVSGSHIYVRDLANQTTRIVDTSPSGTPSSYGFNADINADGRYITFLTSDRALTGIPANVDNGARQVVVKDMVSGKLRLVSGTTSNPSQPTSAYDYTSPSIDCDGRIVAFISNAYNLTSPYYSPLTTRPDVYVATIDWSDNTLTRATQAGNGISTSNSSVPQVSCNGTSIAFSSTNSYPGTTTSNMITSAIQYNRLTTTYSMASTNSSGTISNQPNTVSSIAVATSDDGRYIAYTNKGTNLDNTHGQTAKGNDFDVFIRDTKTNVTQLVTFTATGNHSGRVPAGNISLSADGSTLAFGYKTVSGNTDSELIAGINTNRQDVYISKTGF